MDFDRVIERRGTGSTKWERYPADVLPLWVADMDFASPPAVTEALRARVEHGVYGYARVPESLVEAIRTHLLDSHGWPIEPEWLVFLPGAVPGLNLACRAVGAPGDAVMMITPIYPPFRTAPGFQQRRMISRAVQRRRRPLAAAAGGDGGGRHPGHAAAALLPSAQSAGAGLVGRRDRGGRRVLPPPRPGALLGRDPLRPDPRRPAARAGRHA